MDASAGILGVSRSLQVIARQALRQARHFLPRPPGNALSPVEPAQASHECGAKPAIAVVIEGQGRSAGDRRPYIEKAAASAVSVDDLGMGHSQCTTNPVRPAALPPRTPVGANGRSAIPWAASQSAHPERGVAVSDKKRGGCANRPRPALDSDPRRESRPLKVEVKPPARVLFPEEEHQHQWQRGRSCQQPVNDPTGYYQKESKKNANPADPLFRVFDIVCKWIGVHRF